MKNLKMHHYMMFVRGCLNISCELRSHPKLFISWAVGSFYGREIEIWAGFGTVGSTEKKILSPLLPRISCFQGPKNLNIILKIL